MEEKLTVSVNGKSISIGKARNGLINLITNFNLFNYPDLVNLIRNDWAVDDIYSIQNYSKSLGGIALLINEYFDYQDFYKRLTEYLNDIYHEVQK